MIIAEIKLVAPFSPKIIENSIKLLLLIVIICASLNYLVVGASAAEKLDLLDKPIPMKKAEDFPQRVPPLIQWGGDFLGTGNIPSGIELPTGAVWIPSLWVYGNSRTSFNYVDPGDTREKISEIVTRLDLNFNLKLSGTERIFMQLQPLRHRGETTGYAFQPSDRNFTNAFNPDITALFFEGDFGEIFPLLDPDDSRALDIGIALGRQQIFFQEGIMLNDTIDAIGLTRDTLIFEDIVDTRMSILFGWSNLDRDNNVRDGNAKLFGIFTETDLRISTVALDAAYVMTDDDVNIGGDGLYFGLSSVQRIEGFNIAAYVNTSFALDDESNGVRSGTLLFSEISTEPAQTHDIIYLNSFVGFDDYSSAARGKGTGGPLGRMGILFAAVGNGNYPAALTNRANEAIGATLGYQKFFNDDRTNLTTEIGGIASLESDGSVQDGFGLGIRLQQKILTRYLFQSDAFIADRENDSTSYGIRTEIQVQF
jgi:hypothetical protein